MVHSSVVNTVCQGKVYNKGKYSGYDQSTSEKSSKYSGYDQSTSEKSS
jgi:hypothetical protein